MSTELQRRKLILHKYMKNEGLTIRKIAKKVNLPNSTVGKVLKNFKERLTIERKPGSGGLHNRRLNNAAERVLKEYSKNPKISSRTVAKTVKKSQSFVQKIKKIYGLRSYKAQAAPDRNAKQNMNAKSRCRKLYDTLLTKHECVIMDDETYCYKKFKYIAGQDFYTAKTRRDAPEECKKKVKSKFPQKFLVWQAICSCGLKSEPYLTTGTINSQIYVDECLQKRLLPFIRKHQVKYLFWPDLASCHYANNTIKWYKEKQVNFVPRDCNPPNSPELRPIEQYWSIVKGILKKTGQEIQTIGQFKSKWQWASKKINKASVQKIMGPIRRKVRSVAYCTSFN